MEYDIIICPNDGCHSGIIEKIDNAGAHIECAECGLEWIDPLIKLEKIDDVGIHYICTDTGHRGCYENHRKLN